MSKISSKHKKKIVRKASRLHPVHLFAVIVLGSYFFLSKLNTLYSFFHENIILTFMQLYFFGTFFGIVFLYLLSHEKFFPVAKEIEKEEKENEKKLLKKYINHGKFLATILIAIVGGPVFAAITARLLLFRYKYKYLLIAISNIPATILTLTLGNGLIYFLKL